MTAAAGIDAPAATALVLPAAEGGLILPRAPRGTHDAAAGGSGVAAPALITARRPFSEPRVALIHYWLVGMRGGERVLERILRLWPDADIFTHVHVPEAMSAAIRARPVTTTFINRLPGAARHYQKYLALMPLALEQLDLSAYDLVISSESGPAKGVIARPDARHLSYVHSPMRYLWDHYHDYRRPAGLLTRMAMPFLCHYLRGWDAQSAARVDSLVANSQFIRRRIARAWGREADVVHPPVATDLFAAAGSGINAALEVGSRYLWVGQMTSYKRPDIVVEAFNRLRLPLLMVGDGDMYEAVRRRAGPNVEVVQRLDLAGLRNAYASARALVFAAEEDFGIVPVEANASGRPVLAFGRGGILDSIVPGETGLFFDAQSVEAIIAGVEAMERWLPGFDPARAVANAARFAPEHFDTGFRNAVDAVLAAR